MKVIGRGQSRRDELRGLTLLLAALTVLVSGCTTQFVAKSTNPLKPAKSARWDPGELSQTTQSRIAALGLRRSWRDDPAAAIGALEPTAGDDTASQRAVMEVALAAGMRAHRKFLTNRGAAGLYLCAMEHAFDAAARGDAEFQRFSREVSRYALARLADLREMATKQGSALSNEVAGPTRIYHVAVRTNVPGAFPLGRFHALRAADEFKIVGARTLALVDGAGTPLVGKMRGPVGTGAAKSFTIKDGQWLPFTATAHFGPRGPQRRAIFTIYDRRNVETARIGPRQVTLAADFSTPFAVRTRELNQQNIFSLGILGFLRGDQFFNQAGLEPIEVPRTDKIPVVFVHGLISSPNDWRFLHNALLTDPLIRKRYQFWAFFYPTSMAVPWSSAILRRDLARVREQLNPGGRNTALSRMILLGHSMGGMLSRMQISGAMDQFYRQYFTKPIDRLRLRSRERAMVKEMFHFSPNPDIDGVVFICVPHKGSNLATNWIGKVGRILARLPLTVVETSVNVLTLNADALAADISLTPSTSIDSLSPRGKYVKALQLLQMSRTVKKHSIIGDRGAGGDPWRTSDGVVPYWSSHLEGVPETIISSNHSGPEHPQCAEKVKELLRANLAH
jgi:hypothetical protein